MVPFHLLLLFSFALLEIRCSIAGKHLLEDIDSFVHLWSPIITCTPVVSLALPLLKHLVVLLGKHKVLEGFVPRNQGVHLILAVYHVLTYDRALFFLLHGWLGFTFRFVVGVQPNIIVFDHRHILLVRLTTRHSN